MQQSNLALMFLGKVPHPDRGETVRDLDSAQLFIDQLEMLETKTKGNLNSHESALLKQTLMTLRLAFVEAVNAPPPPPAAAAEAKATETKATDTKLPETKPPETPATGTPEKPPPSSAEEGPAPKRFSKKFS